MNGEPQQEPLDLHDRTREVADALEAQAVELVETTKRIEGHTGVVLGMRTRVEVGETLRRVRVLVRTVGGLDKSSERGGASATAARTKRSR